MGADGIGFGGVGYGAGVCMGMGMWDFENDFAGMARTYTFAVLKLKIAYTEEW